MAGRTAQEWDERYASGPWPTGPSPTVVEGSGALVPGRAVDLAAGTGRHALWLASLGWEVVAVDTSAVGLAQGRARDDGAAVTWVCDDARTWSPDGPVDLVLVAYAHLGLDGLRRAAGWLAPGGHLVVAGHARRLLRPDAHGPRDPAMRHAPEDLRAAAEGLTVVRLEERERPDDGGPTLDALLVARR